MKTILAVVALLCAADAGATPMMKLCLPSAPKKCALTAESKPEEYLACFDDVTLDDGDPVEAACDEELRHAKVHRACDTADIPALCKDVKPGDGRVMACLRDHRQELSPACGKAVDSYRRLVRLRARKGRKGSSVTAVRC